MLPSARSVTNYIKSPKTEKCMKPKHKESDFGWVRRDRGDDLHDVLHGPHDERAADGYCRHAGIDVGR